MTYVGKVIYRELCKKEKFDHTAKYYMPKAESVFEKKMYKILCDFEIQTDHQTPARIPELAIINKKIRTWHIVDFIVPAGHRVKI